MQWQNLKRGWSERQKKKKWIFVDAGKYALCFCRAPGGKVWNLIKPLSGGVALIRDSLNKQQVPRENKIYMLQHELSLHLAFCLRWKRAVVLETAEPFQFQPEATFSSQRSVLMCQKYLPWSLPSACFSIKLPKVQISSKHVFFMFFFYVNEQLYRCVMFGAWCQERCVCGGFIKWIDPIQCILHTRFTY